GQQQDAVGGNALLQQERDAIDQSTGFTCARAGDDQGRAGQGRDGVVLLWIQFARVVNLEVDRRTELWQRVVTRHSMHSKGKRENEKAKRVRGNRPPAPLATGFKSTQALRLNQCIKRLSP